MSQQTLSKCDDGDVVMRRRRVGLGRRATRGQEEMERPPAERPLWSQVMLFMSVLKELSLMERISSDCIK